MPITLAEMVADARSEVGPSLTADPTARILLYCTKGPGARSLLSARTLTNMGYERVEVLSGGLVAWTEAGLPVDGETRPAAV